MGCAAQPVKIRTETVEVLKPVIYCPKPDTSKLNRPDRLYIEDITSDTKYGETAIKYKATVKQLIDYIDRLELLLQEYEKYDDIPPELKEVENSEQP